MTSFFIGGGGSNSTPVSTIDWTNITNKPNIDIAGLSIDFNFSDTFPKLIGNVPNNLNISEVEIEIITLFDDGILLTIGDSIDNEQLMSSLENEPQVALKFSKDSDYKYSVATDIYLYISGIPTQGSGKIRVYFD